MAQKSKTNWYSMMGKQERTDMEKHNETDIQTIEKRSKKEKAVKENIPTKSAQSFEGSETKATVKIVFEGEVAQRILKCEAELKESLSKPDMGKILGNEILSWSKKRWAEIVEENTNLDFFFEQIKKHPDRSKSIKLLKTISEKLKSENVEGTSTGLTSSVGSATIDEDSKSSAS